MLKKVLAVIFLLLNFACEDFSIIVSPPEIIKGVAYTYQGDKYSIKNSRVTIHEISKNDYLNESVIFREANIKEDSSFSISLPRHEVPSTRFILRVISPIAGSLVLYGFASAYEVEVSIFSTVVYELISKNTSVNVQDFTDEELKILIELAKTIFYEKVDNYHIQLKYSVGKIYKALQNAVASSEVFMNKYNELTKRNILAEYPFNWEDHNTPPYINSVSPILGKGHILSITETQERVFDVTAFDLEGANIFYVWYLDNELVEQSKNFNLFYVFATDYNSSGFYELKVEVSDGGIVSSFTWLIRVLNKNRAPTVISTCYEANALIEDVSYTCLIDVEDKDGDYPIVFEGHYFDTSSNTVKGITDINLENKVPLCIGDQRTGEQRNCLSIINKNSAFFTFTPTNCQTGSYSFTLRLLDSYFDKYANPPVFSRSQFNYSILYLVQDINIKPEFLSFHEEEDLETVSIDISNLEPVVFEITESHEFSKIIKVRDLDSLSPLVHTDGTLDDDCPDILNLSFINKPLGMTLTNLYVENNYDSAYLGYYRIKWRLRFD